MLFPFLVVVLPWFRDVREQAFANFLHIEPVVGKIERRCVKRHVDDG